MTLVDSTNNEPSMTHRYLGAATSLIILSSTHCLAQTVFNGQMVSDVVDIVSLGFKCHIPPYDIPSKEGRVTVMTEHTYTGDQTTFSLKTETMERTYSQDKDKDDDDDDDDDDVRAELKDTSTYSETNKVAYADLESVTAFGNEVLFQCRRGEVPCIRHAGPIFKGAPYFSQNIHRHRFRVCDENIANTIKTAVDFLISFNSNQR
jgi:hypothetical protein